MNIVQHLQQNLKGLVEEGLCLFLELHTRDHNRVVATVLIGILPLVGVHLRENNFDRLRLLSQTRHQLRIRRVNGMSVGLQRILQNAHHDDIQIVSTKMGVSSRRQNSVLPIHDRQNGHIKRATSQIVHENLLIVLVVFQSVRNGSSRGLV